MDLRSKHTAVLTDSPSLAKAGLSLPSLASVVPAPSLFPYSSSTALFSPRSALNGSVLISRRKIFPSELEDVCTNAWLEAMKSASPPRIRCVKDFNLEVDTQGMLDAPYDTWIIKHPSALSLFEQIMNSAKGKKIALFLDYDGTLSPIVDDPDQAYMSDAMRLAVKNVARYFPTAIISGRGRDKVYDFVRLAELYYAGSHGMDIMGPAKPSAGSNGYNVNCTKITNKKGKGVVLFQPASEFLPMIDEVFKLLVEKTKRFNGAKVENNNFCVSVHFRCVEEKYWSALAEHVRGVLQDYPRLHVTKGRKVLEIRPSIKWDKGKALEFLLDSLGLAKCSDVLPLYIGDDRTDEDAFKVLRNTGQGYGILVSSVPKETNAFYSLRDPSEVMSFLRRLVKWKKLSMKADVKRNEHCKNLAWHCA